MWNVLLVDDNPEMRFLYSRILRYLGCEVIEFPDVATAQKVLQYTNPFDLIITDLNMPSMDGVEFTQWVKDLYPEMPVILISASPHPRLQAEEKKPDYCIFGLLNRDKFKNALEHVQQLH